jgi:hypothetical protein
LASLLPFQTKNHQQHEKQQKILLLVFQELLKHFHGNNKFTTRNDAARASKCCFPALNSDKFCICKLFLVFFREAERVRKGKVGGELYGLNSTKKVLEGEKCASGLFQRSSRELVRVWDSI